MSKLLSIIMPTFNRGWILEYSLGLIKEQIIRNKNDVEFIVCNNASQDNTSEIIEKVLKEDNFFKFVNYDEYVEIGISLSRSIENGTGKYFMLLGDDDIPDPYMIDVIVASLKKYPDLACVHFNRMQGNPSDNWGLKNLNVFYKDHSVPEILYTSSKEFIKERYRGMCFLSCYAISKEAWIKGQSIWTKEHFGFEYLAPILYGISGGNCLYLSYPLCIQRFLEVPQYIDKWPLYVYVGIPRVLQCLEQLGCIDNWRECYNNYHSAANNDDYVGHILMIASKQKDIYLPYYDEIYSNISTKFRHSILKLIKLPNWILKILQVFYCRIPWYIKKTIIPQYKYN